MILHASRAGDIRSHRTFNHKLNAKVPYRTGPGVLAAAIEAGEQP
jgi:hypothetical protein